MQIHIPRRSASSVFINSEIRNSLFPRFNREPWNIAPFVTSQKADMQKFITHTIITLCLLLLQPFKSDSVCSSSSEHVKGTTKHQIKLKECAACRKQRAKYDLFLFFGELQRF